MKRFMWVIAVLAVAMAVLNGWAQNRTPAELRQAMRQGNYKDAYDGLAPKVTAAEGTDQLVEDYRLCLQALQNLGRWDEIDGFREKAIAAHPADWPFLLAAAQSYRDLQHYGVIIAGEYRRGGSRGGDGKWVSSLDRDRVRALQLMQQAAGVLQKINAAPAGAANFYYELASMLLLGDNGQDAWRLQTLTDLGTLPDYDETGRPYYYRGWQPARGAPVDGQGNPIFHVIPKGGWEGAKTDGERWRWALLQASEMSPAEAQRSRMMLATFLHDQFGVQTMAGYGALIGRAADDGKTNESGPYAVYSLKDDETIARLANGIRRFKLPDEFNYIKQLEAVAAAGGNPGGSAADAMDLLARSYEDRQQYDTAASWWQKDIAQFGVGSNSYRQRALEQIVGNWGQLDNVLTQPAGKDGAKVDYRFRNGTKVAFSATAIDVPALLADVKAYVKTRPNQMNWQQVDLSNIGYRLVVENQAKYLGKEVASWEVPLTPREKHFDKRITVETPLKAGGAYLLVGKMENGNITRVVVWVADTVIVKKPLDRQSLTYVADAVTGQPVPGAQVEFFGYRQQWLGNNNAAAARQYRMDIQEYAAATNGDGEVIVGIDPTNNDQPPPAIDPARPSLYPGMSWVTTASTKDGRFAFAGFTGIWAGSYYDQYDSAYNQTKAFIMTDRPVYRPGQKVQFKMWVGENKYDVDGKSRFAGQTAMVEIVTPKGDKLKDISATLDEWGGMSGELELEKQATLGGYTISNPNGWGAVSFRVEEYKKPEYEVKIDAPSEPVMLGEKITATINAKYYFGSPVVNAKVKYKVTRTNADARWYPMARWDWFYEPGYWWFAADYRWYPGFGRWGMLAPMRRWWPGGWSNEQPEVISENEVAIGPDGTVKVEIDTSVAKAAYGDEDHKYEISAEVTDASRRTIVGNGTVLVAREPFKVYAWVDRGFFNVGDTIHGSFSAQTLDNKPVAGKGLLKLMRVTYDAKAQPVEEQVQQWDLATKEDGRSEVQINAQRAGQYRLSYAVTDAKNHTIEGGYVFVIRGAGFTGKEFRFNDIEVTTDKKEYKAGEKVKLMVTANRADSAVLLFVRPSNGAYLPPKVIRLNGKSTVEEVEVGKKDMPNFFVEALTVADAKVFTDVREIIVPPEDRVLDVSVTSDASEYKPGQKAKFTVKVMEKNGEPFTGSAVMSLYDKSVEYISGGTNIGDIRKYFWQWRRTHNVQTEDSVSRASGNVLRNGEIGMGYLGVFGVMATEFGVDRDGLAQGEYKGMMNINGGVLRGMARGGRGGGFGGGGGAGAVGGVAFAAEGMDMRKSMAASDALMPATASPPAEAPAQGPNVEASVRTNFADTALWAPKLVTAVNGTATVEVTMPESLTTWKAKLWTLGAGSRVGQGETEVVTRKNLIVRLEAPRFFVQTDQVVISAIVHNYLKSQKRATVSIELDGGTMGLEMGNNTWAGSLPTMTANIMPNGEQRIDWLVKVAKEGNATIRVKALTDEESDATQMSFPVYVHGMLKTESFAGALRGDGATLNASVKLNVPKERRPEQSLLEVRYSPSLASAMVDALPYMVDYPYGCTEQTLNRFVPTVITQKILVDMKLDLKAIRDKRTNLNAQEIGDAAGRAAQWKRYDRNPVFDPAEVGAMVKDGVLRLTNMQNADGGWGWFSGTGEYSWPHTTALVVHGLQIARDNGAAVDAGVIERGVQWLKGDQQKRFSWIMADRAVRKAGDMDAFEYMVLADANADNVPMRGIIYEDRNLLAVYSKAMFGLAMLKVGDKEKLAMMLENCRQFVVQDDENQTAYLKLPGNNAWWYWYGSEYEAQGYYLKLLAATDGKGQTASRLAKYLINNRKNATYWNSTRDTAVCIEAMADYIRASGEDKPDMTVRVAFDGKQVKEAKINAENLFSFDNAWILPGLEIPDGAHVVDIARTGTGPLYYNTYLTNFTMENHITAAGLEIKVNRKVYLLTRDDKTIKAEGEHGQAVDKRVEKYVRTELSDGQTVKSGDLVEVELEVDSKNDYEYIILEDMKAAGFEAVEVRSGYNGNDLNAYVEFRDERVAFFVRALARGKHSVSYRLRAEVPGAFSSLPTKASAMYAPELRANSDEIKLRIIDAPK